MVALIKGIAGIINTISGLFLDDSPEGRSNAMRKMYSDPRSMIGVPWTGGIDGAPLRVVWPLAGVRALDETSGTSPQEDIVNTALYETQRALRMNELIKELPFVAFDSFHIELEQSYQVRIPSQSSLIQTNYCSPIMNLGQQFKDLIQEYFMYKVESIQVMVRLQNQNYSTQTIAYDPVVTYDDMRTMQNDLLTLANQGSDPATAATGHAVQYFMSVGQSQEVVGPDGKQMGTASEYLRALSDITSLENTAEYPVGQAAQMGIEGPSFRLVSMRQDHSSNPVEQDPNSYISFDAGRNFFEKVNEQNANTLYVDQMPVFGKFHFAMSNMFEKDVDLITGIKYRLVCKRRRQQSGYLPSRP